MYIYIYYAYSGWSEYYGTKIIKITLKMYAFSISYVKGNCDYPVYKSYTKEKPYNDRTARVKIDVPFSVFCIRLHGDYGNISNFTSQTSFSFPFEPENKYHNKKYRLSRILWPIRINSYKFKNITLELYDKPFNTTYFITILWYGERPNNVDVIFIL